MFQSVVGDVLLFGQNAKVVVILESEYLSDAHLVHVHVPPLLDPEGLQVTLQFDTLHQTIHSSGQEGVEAIGQ